MIWCMNEVVLLIYEAYTGSGNVVVLLLKILYWVASPLHLVQSMKRETTLLVSLLFRLMFSGSNLARYTNLN